MVQELMVDDLKVANYKTRKEMGAGAAEKVAEKIKLLLSVKHEVNMIFAAAPSQSEFLDFLSLNKTIPWKRVNAFHMDEYIGLNEEAPQRFGNFLKEKIFGRVPFRAVHYLKGDVADVAAECERYTNLLEKFPPDIVCMGIGENTHIAFNDPHVADFNDIHQVKVVDLDTACRQQQVNDGCFPQFDDVPSHALTLTVPALMNADYIFCIVPGINKRDAVYLTLNEKISSKYPSTILRTHPNSILFLDSDSSSKLANKVSIC